MKIGHRSRIIQVLLNNIPFLDWPENISGATGFPFHDSIDPENFGDALDPGSYEFRTQMFKLRDAVWGLITDFMKGEMVDALHAEIETVKGKGSFKIFFAEVSDSLRITRKRIISELQHAGISVIEGFPPPYDKKGHENAIIQSLSACDLAIHMLDENPGKEIIDDISVCYPQKQAEISLETEKPKLIWIPEDLSLSDVEDEDYKWFLQSQSSEQIKNPNVDFIRGSRSTLKQQILDAAELIQAKPKIIGRNMISVLVDTHFKDQNFAFDLSKALLENHIQPFINPQEDDPKKNINLLGDRLSQVSKLIFLYGNASREWVQERMNAALQLIITNNYPVDDFYVYMVPPRKNTNEISINQKFLKINVLDNSKTTVLDQEVVRDFLNGLKIQAL